MTECSQRKGEKTTQAAITTEKPTCRLKELPGTVCKTTVLPVFLQSKAGFVSIS